MFICHLRDGRTIKESEKDWKEVTKESNNLKDITSLQLKRENSYYTVSVDGKNVELIQLKTNIADPIAGTNELVERKIGFNILENENVKYQVKMSVNEKTGNVVLTLYEKIDGKWHKL